MSSKKEKFASFGIATKGIVYFIIGGLTAMAAFGYGGQKSGSDTVLKFIANQSFGKVLLVLLAIGLLGYVFWRWYQAFTDPKNIEDSAKSAVKRIAYFISGALYGLLAYSAIKLVVGSNGSGDSLATKVFQSDYAATVAIIIGLALVGKGMYEVYRAYSGKYKENIEGAGIPSEAQGLLLKAGRFGHTSRGIVAGILGYLFLKAGFAGTANKLGKTDAFGFIQDEFGNIVLGIIALGLVGYGVFMMIKAKYSSLSVD
jgi:Domain of Unknown Function (DUF1206)